MSEPKKQQYKPPEKPTPFSLYERAVSPKSKESPESKTKST